MPTLKDSYDVIKNAHDIEVDEIQEKISTLLNECSYGFTKKTGFFITGLEIVFHEHYSTKGNDMSIITSVDIKTSLED